MNISIPNLSLVVLIGPSGAGKSTFARRHFLASEVLTSDFFRGLVSDDENNQAATNDAFDVLHYVASRRLSRGRLTVIDATNVQREARAPLVHLARQFHCLPVAIVFDLPEAICHERNGSRADRNFGPHVVRQQKTQMRRSLRGLAKEGFRHVFTLDNLEAVDAATIERVPLWNDRREDCGPFDIIGDLHGCADELEELLERLGYTIVADNPDSPLLTGGPTYAHPAGRKAVFVGDLVDRGPRILDCLRIVRNMVHAGSGLCVPGNHDIKLLKKLKGKDVRISYGLAQTMAEIDRVPVESQEPLRDEMIEFLDGLVSHYVLDGGNLVVAHAGMKEEMQGRGSGRVRDFALYGETAGETDDFGLPIRHSWAAEYRGSAMVVYGHTPVPYPDWLNNTIDIDTGCVFGGSLTALRYPEREFVSVPARRVYCEPSKPFLPNEAAASNPPAQLFLDDVLDAEDVIGKRIVGTRLAHQVTIREANAAAALEVMSRFAINPKWLIYLPPTMAPSETTTLPGLLEHPAETFGYFLDHGIPKVVCEEKHMGSRAIVIVCRDEASARNRFGVADEAGVVYTRTGRRFFNDLAMERELLEQVRSALSASGFWDEFATSWACLDCELMPWSAKAQELLRSQYAAVGAAGNSSMTSVVASLEAAAIRLAGPARLALDAVRTKIDRQHEGVRRFVSAYRNYCWDVRSTRELKLAPFHLLASEGAVHASRDHVWHMETIGRIAAAGDGVVQATRYLEIDVTHPNSVSSGIEWWEALTAIGGEGMVVKPRDFIARGTKGLMQPAVKCRGKEYLRIIYGPDYDAPENLERLRHRGLGAKRSLASREFALGIEALERFVRREPLRRVHECVFGVLALESEPVDPRL